MKIYYWMQEEHEDEFEKVPENENFLGLEPKANTTAEGIRDYYQFLVECEDETGMIIHNAKELSKRMIEKFKSSKCYALKTEDDRRNIIAYLKANPGAEPYRMNSSIDY